MKGDRKDDVYLYTMKTEEDEEGSIKLLVKKKRLMKKAFLMT
jgi:hypothetical protein